MILNAIALATIQYEEDHKQDLINRVINYMNAFFTFIFFLEMIFKIVSMGFVLDKHTYLRDYLNCLDLLIVIAGYNYFFELL